MRPRKKCNKVFEKKPRERMEWIKKYLAVDPQSWELWFNLGIKYSEIEDYDKAIESFEEAEKYKI